jgi:nucleoside diphosphate kinase
MRRQFGAETTRSAYEGITALGSPSVAEQMRAGASGPYDVASTVRELVGGIDPRSEFAQTMRNQFGPDATRSAYKGITGFGGPTLAAQPRAGASGPYDVASTVRELVGAVDPRKEFGDAMRRQFGAETTRSAYEGITAFGSPSVVEQMRAAARGPYDVASTMRELVGGIDPPTAIRDALLVSRMGRPELAVAPATDISGFVVLEDEASRTFLGWLAICCPSISEAKAACEWIGFLATTAMFARAALRGEAKFGSLAFLALAWISFVLGLLSDR